MSKLYIGFFDIFWDIWNKMKENLDQECVYGGHLSFQGKLEQLPWLPWKNDSFPVLTLFYYLSLPKLWLSHPHKNYIFEMRDKFHNVIFRIQNLVAILILVF